jgi:myo-inositol-1(or 4)-monophosphatase
MFDFLVDISKQAGAYLLSQFGGDLLIEHKGRIDLVTHADRVSQKIIIKNIEKRFPGHAIVAEEGYDKSGKEGFSWYIDPIDGTTNFVHGVPIFCISIALYKELSPLFGICYNPASQETFCAEKGKGSFLNGKRIQVSTTWNLIDALVATGFPYERENMGKVIERLFTVVSGVQGIRRLGSAALDLCYVACGRFDAFWEMGLKPWDMAAGVLILEEAGGMVTSAEGTEFDLTKGNIAASNKVIHNKFLQLLYL